MSRRRSRTTPPTLSTLLVTLAILAAFWIIQNGYLDRLLGRTPTSAPSAVEAPEQAQDGTQIDPSRAPEPTVPQPSTAPVEEAAPVQQTVDTVSLSGYAGAWYQVYFTKPEYPEKAADRMGGMDEAIVADLDAAKQRIELVVFDLDLPKITDALIRAKGRGVAVRVSVDGENLEAAVTAKAVGDVEAAGIPVFIDKRQAFMHNKFFVIDDRIVWTGSTNMTVNDVFRNNNTMLRIMSAELAQNYLAKADDIFNNEGGTAGGSVLVNPALTIGGAQVQTAFAPDEPITDMVVQRINDAQGRVDVLAFAFTSDPIADALIAAKGRGVAVRGVMETRNTKGTGSEFATLRDAGVDFLADGNCYILHSKVMIIDGRTVITGSFNWTASAQDQNDENVLLIDDPSLAARYTEEFERIYAQALQPTRCR